MDFESLVKHPVVGQTIIAAIEDGREWGQRFLHDPSWRNHKSKMAKYAIYESNRTILPHKQGTGETLLVQETFSYPEISLELHTNLYSQIKLAATLFTIYEIDTKSPLMHPLIIAAAAGVEIQELADYLGTQNHKSAIRQALMTKRGKGFWDINRNLGMKLIAQIHQQDLTKNVAKFLPVLGNNALANTSLENKNPTHQHPEIGGSLIMSFIQAWNAS